MKITLIIIVLLLASSYIMPTSVQVFYNIEPTDSSVPLLLLSLSFWGYLIGVSASMIRCVNRKYAIHSLLLVAAYVFIIPAFTLPITPPNNAYINTLLGGVEISVIAFIPLLGYIMAYIFCKKTYKDINSIPHLLFKLICIYVIISFLIFFICGIFKLMV